MANAEIILKKCVWLIDTIREAGQITFKEINQLWMNDTSVRSPEEGAISERTFFRHRNIIRELLGVVIACHHNNGNTYYIENEESLYKLSPYAWVFIGTSLNNISQDENLRNRIIFEEIPSGHRHIPAIFAGIAKGHKLKVKYLPYKSYYPIEILVEPLFLKQFRRRWYLICKSSGNDSLLVIALERILSVSRTYDNFFVNQTDQIFSSLNERIGVDLKEEYSCEKVIVRIYGNLRESIKNLPIHKSQQYYASTKDYTDYAFILRPDGDFQSEILSLGTEAEVISPQWLREELLARIEDLILHYKKAPM